MKEFIAEAILCLGIMFFLTIGGAELEPGVSAWTHQIGPCLVVAVLMLGANRYLENLSKEEDKNG